MMANLKRLRVALAMIAICGITLLFLDFTGAIHLWLGWLAKMQFVAAVTSANLVVVALILLFTLLFGRIYCSVICPLGIFQDVVSKFASKRKKFRFRFSKELKSLRFVVLTMFATALAIGVGSFTALIEPYSIFGRIASNIFAPIWQAGNNVLAYFAERADSYTFYSTEVWLKSAPTFIIAVISLIVIIVLSWRNGRTYCNSFCPVGTLLGYVAKFSIFKPRIDQDKCNSCGLCEKSCKSSCIDSKNKTIDYSRCVTCLDCTLQCKKGALSYSRKSNDSKAPLKSEDKVDSSKRQFLASALVLGATAVKAQEIKTDGGLAVIVDKQIPNRTTHIIPAGAMSAHNFHSKCTGCQLCVSVCPNQVLRPSGDVMRLMQPELSFERGYCRPECTKCSDVCPAGAIRPISREEKSSTSIGTATWIKKNCVVVSDGVHCGNCAAKCPSGAITMVKSADADGRKVPAINPERCIGCGACEYVCPAAPFSAIYVEGKSRHNNI